MALTLPNRLTVARIVALVPITVLLSFEAPLARWIALLLFAAAAVTDWLDGRLARARGETTALGRCLDPIADKLLVAAPLVVLLGTGDAPMVPVLVILLRELVVSGLREALASQGPALPVTRLAKWKTTVQMVALAVLIVGAALPGAPLVGSVLLWLAAALTAVTGAQYAIAAVRDLAARPAARG